MKSIFFWCAAILLGLTMGELASPVAAHPMGNFSINHYARFEAQSRQLAFQYIVDYAEIPTTERMTQLDTNGDNQVTENEKRVFLQGEAASLLKNLTLQLDSQPVSPRQKSAGLDLRAGAGGLDTLRVVLGLEIPLLPGKTHDFRYQDANFPGRTGWMEVIALGGAGTAIRQSTAASTDRSRGLTVFPLGQDAVTPRQREATFTLVPTGKNAAKTPLLNAPKAPEINDQTPQNRFTQTIAERELTPGLMLAGVLVSLLFGAMHSLSPGHGKTMVAAYLVGSRGTPRHAVLLGLVVTITHTFGVFALGLALLFASRYVLPERLFPALSAASGLIVFGVGLWLLMSRWQALTANHSHSHHAHDHAHDNAHDHSHGDGHVHSHGGKSHSHGVPEGPITMRTLIALGISGGIVPCPEALVVLLAAVKMHRLGYGMVLIAAFSVGLAAALIGIGLAVVFARQKLSRFDHFGEGSLLSRYLPLGSAAVITVIGIVLTINAVGPGTP